MSVIPRCSRVAIDLSPVTLQHIRVLSLYFLSTTYIPGRSAIEGFCSIMPTFTMASHEQHFVVDILWSFLVQPLHLTVESLPLAQLVEGMVARICLVRPIYQAKIRV